MRPLPVCDLFALNEGCSLGEGLLVTEHSHFVRQTELYEVVIRVYKLKNVRRESIIEVCQAVYENM